MKGNSVTKGMLTNTHCKLENLSVRDVVNESLETFQFKYCIVPLSLCRRQQLYQLVYCYIKLGIISDFIPSTCVSQC